LKLPSRKARTYEGSANLRITVYDLPIVWPAKGAA
jgi:hypothetical protein